MLRLGSADKHLCCLWWICKGLSIFFSIELGLHLNSVLNNVIKHLLVLLLQDVKYVIISSTKMIELLRLFLRN